MNRLKDNQKISFQGSYNVQEINRDFKFNGSVYLLDDDIIVGKSIHDSPLSPPRLILGTLTREWMRFWEMLPVEIEQTPMLFYLNGADSWSLYQGRSGFQTFNDYERMCDSIPEISEAFAQINNANKPFQILSQINRERLDDFLSDSRVDDARINGFDAELTIKRDYD